jgi:hypothetical protein
LQTCLQVSENGGQRSAFELLTFSHHLPETFKGLSQIALFAVKAACLLFSRMTMQLPTQDSAKASLPRLSGLLAALPCSAVKQFQAELSIGQVPEAIVLNLAHATLFEGREVQHT